MAPHRQSPPAKDATARRRDSDPEMLFMDRIFAMQAVRNRAPEASDNEQPVLPYHHRTNQNTPAELYRNLDYCQLNALKWYRYALTNATDVQSPRQYSLITTLPGLIEPRKGIRRAPPYPARDDETVAFAPGSPNEIANATAQAKAFVKARRHHKSLYPKSPRRWNQMAAGFESRWKKGKGRTVSRGRARGGLYQGNHNKKKQLDAFLKDEMARKRKEVVDGVLYSVPSPGHEYAFDDEDDEVYEDAESYLEDDQPESEAEPSTTTDRRATVLSGYLADGGNTPRNVHFDEANSMPRRYDPPALPKPSPKSPTAVPKPTQRTPEAHSCNRHDHGADIPRSPPILSQSERSAHQIWEASLDEDQYARAVAGGFIVPSILLKSSQNTSSRARLEPSVFELLTRYPAPTPEFLIFEEMLEVARAQADAMQAAAQRSQEEQSAPANPPFLALSTFPMGQAAAGQRARDAGTGNDFIAARLPLTTSPRAPSTAAAGSGRARLEPSNQHRHQIEDEATDPDPDTPLGEMVALARAQAAALIAAQQQATAEALALLPALPNFALGQEAGRDAGAGTGNATTDGIAAAPTCPRAPRGAAMPIGAAAPLDRTSQTEHGRVAAVRAFLERRVAEGRIPPIGHEEWLRRQGPFRVGGRGGGRARMDPREKWFERRPLRTIDELQDRRERSPAFELSGADGPQEEADRLIRNRLVESSSSSDNDPEELYVDRSRYIGVPYLRAETPPSPEVERLPRSFDDVIDPAPEQIASSSPEPDSDPEALVVGNSGGDLDEPSDLDVIDDELDRNATEQTSPQYRLRDFRLPPNWIPQWLDTAQYGMNLWVYWDDAATVYQETLPNPPWVLDRINMNRGYEIWPTDNVPYPVPFPTPDWHPPVGGQPLLPAEWQAVRRDGGWYYIAPTGSSSWAAPPGISDFPDLSVTHFYGTDGFLHPLNGFYGYEPPTDDPPNREVDRARALSSMLGDLAPGRARIVGRSNRARKNGVEGQPIEITSSKAEGDHDDPISVGSFDEDSDEISEEEGLLARPRPRLSSQELETPRLPLPSFSPPPYRPRVNSQGLETPRSPAPSSHAQGLHTPRSPLPSSPGIRQEPSAQGLYTPRSPEPPRQPRVYRPPRPLSEPSTPRPSASPRNSLPLSFPSSPSVVQHEPEHGSGQQGFETDPEDLPPDFGIYPGDPKWGEAMGQEPIDDENPFNGRPHPGDEPEDDDIHVENQTLQARIDQLEQDVLDAQQEARDRTQEANEARSDLSHETQRAFDAEERNVVLTEEISDPQLQQIPQTAQSQTVGHPEGQEARLREIITDREETTRSLRDEHSRDKDDLQKRLDACRTARKSVDSDDARDLEIPSLRRQLEPCRRRGENACNHAKHLQNVVDDLEKKLLESRTLTGSGPLATQLGITERAFNDMRCDYHQHNWEVFHLKKDLEDARDAVKSSTDCQKNLEAAENMISDLQASLEEALGAGPTSDSCDQRCQDTEVQNDYLQNKIDDLERELRTADIKATARVKLNGLLQEMTRELESQVQALAEQPDNNLANELRLISNLANERRLEAIKLQKALDECQKHGEQLQKQLDAMKQRPAPKKATKTTGNGKKLVPVIPRSKGTKTIAAMQRQDATQKPARKRLRRNSKGEWTRSKPGTSAAPEDESEEEEEEDDEPATESDDHEARVAKSGRARLSGSRDHEDEDDDDDTDDQDEPSPSPVGSRAQTRPAKFSNPDEVYAEDLPEVLQTLWDVRETNRELTEQVTAFRARRETIVEMQARQITEHRQLRIDHDALVENFAVLRRTNRAVGKIFATRPSISKLSRLP